MQSVSHSVWKTRSGPTQEGPLERVSNPKQATRIARIPDPDRMVRRESDSLSMIADIVPVRSSRAIAAICRTPRHAYNRTHALL